MESVLTWKVSKERKAVSAFETMIALSKNHDEEFSGRLVTSEKMKSPRMIEYFERSRLFEILYTSFKN
jgi:hypothetical protein